MCGQTGDDNPDILQGTHNNSYPAFVITGNKYTDDNTA